jgi:hypothetical protein
MKAVLEGASYKLSISDPTLNACFSSFIEAGRYRDRVSLQRSYSSEHMTVTYTELIAVIAWELAENQALLPALEIRSWDSFMRMLETAAIYESEVGGVSDGSCSKFEITNNATDITGDSFHDLSQTLSRSTAAQLSKPPLRRP